MSLPIPWPKSQNQVAIVSGSDGKRKIIDDSCLLNHHGQKYHEKHLSGGTGETNLGNSNFWALLVHAVYEMPLLNHC